jgi:uncharacterized membrane protein
MGPGIGLLTVLACGLGGVLWLGVLIWLGMHLLGGRPRDGLGRARSLLHRRLASGEIDVEEYYERESALRQSEPARPRRARLL